MNDVDKANVAGEAMLFSDECHNRKKDNASFKKNEL